VRLLFVVCCWTKLKKEDRSFCGAGRLLLLYKFRVRKGSGRRGRVTLCFGVGGVGVQSKVPSNAHRTPAATTCYFSLAARI
jgi:hypothetical protein